MALVVFSGGARSGKSRAAQALAEQRALDGVPVTAVVFGRHDADPEFALRVQRHREQRPRSFDVIEAVDPTSWMPEAPGDGLLLVDCLGTLLGLVMESEWPADDGTDLGQAAAEALPAGYESAVERSFTATVDWLATRDADTIVHANAFHMATVIEDGRDVVVWYSNGNRITNNRILRGRYGAHFMYSHNNVVERNVLVLDQGTAMVRE